MRRFLYAGAALLTAAALVAGPGGTAYAAPPVNGTTVVTGTPTAGVPLAVQVTAGEPLLVRRAVRGAGGLL